MGLFSQDRKTKENRPLVKWLRSAIYERNGFLCIFNGEIVGCRELSIPMSQGLIGFHHHDQTPSYKY
jgi:hypothetical protein